MFLACMPDDEDVEMHIVAHPVPPQGRWRDRILPADDAVRLSSGLEAQPGRAARVAERWRPTPVEALLPVHSAAPRAELAPVCRLRCGLREPSA